MPRILNTMNCIRGVSACVWIPPFWLVPSRSTRLTAAPGPWLLHGKTSLFQSPSTSPSISPLELAGGVGCRRSQRSGAAGPIGVVHGQCFALCPTVRYFAGAERHSGRRRDFVGGGAGGAAYASDPSAPVRCPPDGSLCLVFCPDRCVAGSPRSEEHTSELQSLMRISYAVFCLKKKKKTVTSESYKSRLEVKKKKKTN